MSHELLGFLSGTFRGSQQRWATVDREGFAIVSTFPLLEYLSWGGVRIYTDHRNFGYIFKPEASFSFRRCQILQRSDSRNRRWCLRSTITPSCLFLVSAAVREICCFGGSMSRRWLCGMSRCSRAVRRMRLCRRRIHSVRYSSRLGLARAPWLAAPLPSNSGEAQRRFVSRGAGWSRHVVDAGTSKENVDAARGLRSHEGCWKSGGRGDLVTAARICCWFRMEVHVTEFVKQCLHCMEVRATTGRDGAREETWQGLAF